jgi:alpha-L-fucosidase 2
MCVKFLKISLFLGLLLGVSNADDNFHIYLAFGQSNMEGQNWNGNSVAYSDVLPIAYKENVNPRFQVMAAVAGSYKVSSTQYEQRVQGQWYKAVPPLARNNLGLSPADYFGRTLVAGISDQNVKVGVIVVAVSGAKIEAFEKGSGAGSYFNTQHGWMKQIAALYGNSPYQRLVDMAKEAQKTGVIKGIIMHQGESGVVSGSWAQKVKGIYDDLLSDLGLPESSIPFLAGQPYGNGKNNANTINKLCSTLNANIAGSAGKKVCHVISSSGCESGGDNLHFSYEGYKTLGERYGEKMLELLY